MTPHGAAERRDLGETKGNIQLLGSSLRCQLARDTMSNWRCPSSAAYGGVWLWIQCSWDVQTASRSALQLCLLSTCVCSGGWQCFYFLMLWHVCWSTWVMLHSGAFIHIMACIVLLSTEDKVTGGTRAGSIGNSQILEQQYSSVKMLQFH